MTACDLLAWAATGAMALTGREDGPPLAAPAPVARRLGQLLARIEDIAPGAAPALDVVLSGRAAALGLGRRGSLSANGSCRLLASAAGWVACNLARPDDVDALGAALGQVPPQWPAPPWAWLAAQLAALGAAGCHQLLETAGTLGVPIVAMGECPARPGPAWTLTRLAPPSAGSIDGALVVDLSALWAGPLVARTLGHAGGEVLSVESPTRPDGARSGPADWYGWLHDATAAEVAVDLTGGPGRAELRALLERADVVIEASRPRALRQLGAAPDQLALKPGVVWLSITGHGRGAGLRTAFGDDAAVAGGLVAVDGEGPVFLADAVADPATGLAGALAVLEARAAGGGVLIDLPMAGVAAQLAAPDPTPCAGPHRVEASDAGWVALCGESAVPVAAPVRVPVLSRD